MPEELNWDRGKARITDWGQTWAVPVGAVERALGANWRQAIRLREWKLPLMKQFLEDPKRYGLLRVRSEWGLEKARRDSKIVLRINAYESPMQHGGGVEVLHIP